jgi:ethanolamine transporter EutH
MNINTGSNKKRGRTWRFFKNLAKVAITPLSSRAKAIIIKDSTVMVAVLENPEIASSGLTKPVNARVAIRSMAILSTAKTSKANRIMVTNRMKKTSIISVVIGRLFYLIKITAETILVPNKFLKY